MQNFHTLTEAFLASEGAGRRLYFVGAGGVCSDMTYAALQTRARQLAGLFAAQNIGKGSRVVLAIRSFPAYFASLWGALLLGVEVIPAIPPQTGVYRSGSQEASRLAHIIELATPVCIIAEPALAEQMRDVTGNAAPILPVSEDTARDGAEYSTFPEIDGEDTAIILFTSGSTSQPKGVPLSHSRVLAGCDSNIQHFGLTGETRFLNWLPLEHITTLVLMHLLPTVLHGEQVHVQTTEILADPKYMLTLLDQFRVNMTFAPNFFYRMLLDQREEIRSAALSLDSVTAVLNGGEMIHYQTTADCVALLAEKGFSPAAMTPGWGMTETGIGAVYSHSFGNSLYGDYVAIGYPIPGLSARLVRDGAVISTEDTEGSLEIKGSFILEGYLNETSEQHREHFTADGWFRTGDLAVLHDGEFFITGRESQIFILNGVNISIPEIENRVQKALSEEADPGLLKALAVRDPASGADVLCIFVEQKNGRDMAQTTATVRQCVTGQFGCPVRQIVCVPEGKFPRTSIGKLDGKALFQNYCAGLYADAEQTTPAVEDTRRTDEENLLLFIWAEALNVGKSALSPDDDFFAVGGDSSKVPNILRKINAAFGVDLNASQFVRYSTVRGLLRFLHAGDAGADIETDDEEEIIVL